MAVTAVVFDVGGVLCPSPVDEFAKVDVEFGLPPKSIEAFIRGGSDFALCETGQRPIADFYRACADSVEADHGVRIPDQRLDEMFTACMGTSVRPEMLALLGRLKAAGLRTGLMTNIFAERRSWLHATFPPELIDVYCDSSEVGLRKPDLAIYHRLLELLDLPAEEVVFVDDFPENLEPARRLGMGTVLFASVEQVLTDLQALGVAAAAAQASEVA